MSQKLKKSLFQTLIYTLSIVVSKGISVLITPILTKYLPGAEEFGQIAYFYVFIAFSSAILSLGLETAYFHFKTKNPKENTEGKMYLIHITIALLFLLLGVTFSTELSGLLVGDSQYKKHFLAILAVIFIDILTIIPFAKLRYDSRPIRYAIIKLINTIINFGSLYFVFVYLLKLPKENLPEFLQFYEPSELVYYYLVINVIASLSSLILLTASIKNIKLQWDKKDAISYLKYGLPIAIGSLAYLINEQADTFFIKWLSPENLGDKLNGIYKANYRVAGLLGIIITGYRLGIEPFFFKHAKNKDAKKDYALVMDIFVILTTLAGLFLLVNEKIILENYIENKLYFEGFKIVPIIILAFIFSGIYNNISVWYKINDKTRYGMYFTLIGATITLILNFIFVPIYGYISSAWITLFCYMSITGISYYLGQKHYPIKYNIKRILTYLVTGFALYFISLQISYQNWLLKNSLLLVYISLIYILEKEKNHKIIRK